MRTILVGVNAEEVEVVVLLNVLTLKRRDDTSPSRHSRTRSSASALCQGAAGLFGCFPR